MIIIVDFGSQTTHLISRRLRELSIDTKIVTPKNFHPETKDIDYNGIILSGGPGDVYAPGAPTIDTKIFDLNKPILGICYGEQLMAHLLGGEARLGKKKEYGPAILEITQTSPLFQFSVTSTEVNDSEHNGEIPSKDEERSLSAGGRTAQDDKRLTTKDQRLKTINVWMSHGVEVTKAPIGFETIGTTETIAHAAIANEEKKQYGIQFHPEVVHTEFGLQILENFAKICGLHPKESPIDETFVNNIIQDIKDSVGNKKAVGAMSGGVDSSIANLLVHKAIGDNLTAVYIDSGLMREKETEELQEIFEKHYDMEIKIVRAADRFLNNLKGITDPEQKRKIIGKTFIDVLEEEAQKLNAEFLVQGTIYPDVIESAGTEHSENIKSHHNVGGLPENMKLMLLEPVRNFYKDEVRKIGEILQLPVEITGRHPFPGPGLAIRIIGEVTKEKLEILRRADRIVQEEINKTEWKDKLWQVFAVYTGIKTTGVRGDNRAYGETIAIRAVESKDVMSSNFAHVPFDLLNKISVRIVTEVPEINRVVYDITNKPPGTIEWE